jgi:hypothetical protein
MMRASRSAATHAAAEWQNAAREREPADAPVPLRYADAAKRRPISPAFCRAAKHRISSTRL